ncbi:hypothetical protein [Streptomyces sp. NPDC057509]|uniref:hypothetical protein n=1 Tax=Streptomyces sp. NPDC057509 TaxID=3346152 RepID=UPI0036CC041A
MPMIVDPSAPQIVQPDRVVSPDGYLAAVVDDLWAGVVLAYDAATPADTAQNLALNPSLTTGLADTQNVGSVTRARVTSDARYGAGSVQHTHTVTGSAGSTWTIAAVSSGTVQVGIWVRIPEGVTSGLLVWRSGTTTLKTTAFALPAAGEWARITGAYTLTSGQSCDRVGLTLACEAGTTWLADGCQAEAGDDLHPYVDGDQPGCVWDGAPNASTSRRVTTDMDPGTIRQVRIMRQDPGGGDPVPVRSGDPAWAIDGVGTAYDHEAPLGAAVIYTATPIHADGSTGPPSSLAVTVPAPAPGQLRDLWLKSLDEPGLSTRVMISTWSGTTSAGRQVTTDVQGAVHRALAYDAHGAEVAQVVIDVPPEQVDRVRALLRSGVLMMQVRPGYLIPDAYFVPADITGPTATGKLGSSGGYLFGFTVEPLDRPDTAGQPMRIPGWSWDILAASLPTWDAVADSYESWAALSTNGVT